MPLTVSVPSLYPVAGVTVIVTVSPMTVFCDTDTVPFASDGVSFVISTVGTETFSEISYFHLEPTTASYENKPKPILLFSYLSGKSALPLNSPSR